MHSPPISGILHTRFGDLDIFDMIDQQVEFDFTTLFRDENGQHSEEEMSDVEGHSNSSLSSGTTEVVISNQPRCRRVKRRLFSKNSRANVSSPLDINQPPASAVDSNVDPFPPVAGNRRNLHPDISTFTSVNAGKSNLNRLNVTLDSDNSKNKKAKAGTVMGSGKKITEKLRKTDNDSTCSSSQRVDESSERTSRAQQKHSNLESTRLTLKQMQDSLQLADSASLATYIRDLNDQDGVPNLSLAPLATASTSRRDVEVKDSCLNTKQRDHKSPAKARDWSSDDDFPTPRQQRQEHKPSPVAISNDDESEAEGSIHSATPSPPPLRNNRHNARAKSTPSLPPLRRKEENGSRVPPRRTRRTSVAESRDGNDNFISAASGRLPESDRDNQVRGRSPVARRRRRRRSRSGTISPDPGLRENVPAPDHRLLSRKRNSIVCAALAAGVQPTPFRLPKNQTPIVPRRPNQSAVPRRELADADKPFHCRRCGKSFTRKDNYRRHKIEKHARVPKVYICDYCGALFCSKRNQEVHIRSRHLVERQFYYCPHCNMRFINRGAKHAHVKICSEKPQLEEENRNSD